MAEKTMRTATKGLLFVVALVVFVLGLGMGFQHDPLVGMALWIAATAIALLNGLWICRSRAGARRG